MGHNDQYWCQHILGLATLKTCSLVQSLWSEVLLIMPCLVALRPLVEFQSVRQTRMAAIGDLLEESRAELRRLEGRLEASVGYHLREKLNNLKAKNHNLAKTLVKVQEENVNLRGSKENAQSRNSKFKWKRKNELKQKVEEGSILMEKLNKLRDKIVDKSKTIGLEDIMENIVKSMAISRERGAGQITCLAQELTRMINSKYVEVPSWRVVEVEDRRDEVKEDEEGVEDMRDEVFVARHARAEEERRQRVSNIELPGGGRRKRGPGVERPSTDLGDVVEEGREELQGLEFGDGEEEVEGVDGEKRDEEKPQEVDEGRSEVVQGGFQGVFQEFLGLRLASPETNVEVKECKEGEARVVQEEIKSDENMNVVEELRDEVLLECMESEVKQTVVEEMSDEILLDCVKNEEEVDEFEVKRDEVRGEWGEVLLVKMDVDEALRDEILLESIGYDDVVSEERGEMERDGMETTLVDQVIDQVLLKWLEGKSEEEVTGQAKHGREKLRCKEEGCGKEFWSQTGLSRHIKAVHQGFRYRCKEENCDSKYYSKQDLMNHGRRKHGLVKLKCTVTGCQRVFSDHSTLRSHIRVVHQKVKPHQCKEEGCEKRFGRKPLLMAHCRLKHGHPKLRCPEEDCQQEFSKLGYLNMHIKVIHRGHRFECEEKDCDAKYKSKGELKQHGRAKHGHPKLTCRVESCDQQFVWERMFYKHIKSHNEK